MSPETKFIPAQKKMPSRLSDGILPTKNPALENELLTNILDEVPETANISIDTGLIRRNWLRPVPSRMWRNWQTRRLQVPVPFGEWRFDSSHPHYIPARSVFAKNSAAIFK